MAQPIPKEIETVVRINGARANPDQYMASLGWPVGSTPTDGQGNSAAKVEHTEPCPPYGIDNRLIMPAQWWSNDEYVNKWYGHVTPSGMTIYSQLVADGYPALANDGCAQLVNQQVQSPEQCVSVWAIDMGRSVPEHRNFMFDVSFVGTACGMGITSGYYTLDLVAEQGYYIVGYGPPGLTIWAVGLDDTTYQSCVCWDAGYYSLFVQQQGNYLINVGWESRIVGVNTNKIQDINGVNNHLPLGNLQWLTWLYGSYLGRAADPAGRNDWLVKLAGGHNREEVRIGFLSSGEYVNSHLADYVGGVFQTVLHRPIRPDERTFYTTLGNNYGVIAWYVVTSAEARTISGGPGQ